MTRQTSGEDRALIVAARHGDQQAREALGQQIGERAYVFALQLTGDREVALDVAQDGVHRFFRRLDRFDPDRPVEPWLYQIVRNRVRDLGRRNRVRRLESLDARLEAGKPDPVEPTAGPAADAERADLQRRIWAAVAELSEPHREIFVLRDHHGLSYREIAEALSIPQGTVMSRLHAARKAMRQMLAAERDDEGSDR